MRVTQPELGKKAAVLVQLISKPENTSTRYIKLGFLVVLFAHVLGCSSANDSPDFNLPPDEFVPVKAVQAGEYRLAVGDMVRVKFLFHTDLNTEVEVRQDGAISVPGLGEFFAYGLSAQQLEADILRRAALTHRNPDVSVVVTNQTIHQVYVGGEVRRPGYVDLRPGMTTLRAIFSRGGFLDTAKVDHVLHVHWDDDGRYSARVLDLKRALETGDVRSDILLSANDLLFIPKTRIANVNLWVRQYIVDLIPIRAPTTRLPEIGG